MYTNDPTGFFFSSSTFSGKAVGLQNAGDDELQPRRCQKRHRRHAKARGSREGDEITSFRNEAPGSNGINRWERKQNKRGIWGVSELARQFLKDFSPVAHGFWCVSSTRCNQQPVGPPASSTHCCCLLLLPHLFQRLSSGTHRSSLGIHPLDIHRSPFIGEFGLCAQHKTPCHLLPHVPKHQLSSESSPPSSLRVVPAVRSSK